MASASMVLSSAREIVTTMTIALAVSSAIREMGLLPSPDALEKEKNTGITVPSVSPVVVTTKLRHVDSVLWATV